MAIINGTGHNDNDTWQLIGENLVFFTHIQGTGDADIITPLSGDDLIYADAGDDVVIEGAGNDTIYGGSGDDTLSYRLNGSGVVIDMAMGIASSATGIDEFHEFENVSGSYSADYITGDALDNVISGNTGADTIHGGAGNDQIFMEGEGSSIDVFDNSDIAYGEDGNDFIKGMYGNDTFYGGAGNDTLIGGTSGMVGSGGQDLMFGEDGNDSLAGGHGNDTLSGGADNDILNGQRGNDSLDGGTGADTMNGQDGADTYIVDSIDDVVDESDASDNISGVTPHGATDLVLSFVTFNLGSLNGSAGNALAGAVENLTLMGGSAINGTGNSLANVIVGNSSDNLLDGAENDPVQSSGGDTLQGGAGNDTYVVHSMSDSVVEASAQGVDLVNSSVSFTLSDNVENLTLAGAASINGYGNSLGNSILGNSAANIISGYDGNDTLDGGAGNDTIYGGSGNDWIKAGNGDDSMVGGIGNDTYGVGSAGDIVVEEAGEGSADQVISWISSYTLGENVEILTLQDGTAAVYGEGNALNNSIIGNSNNNELRGGGGADSLVGNAGYDSLYGGAGNDTMVGGLGDDNYSVQDAGDVIVEASGQGNDYVEVWSTYTLADGVYIEQVDVSTPLSGTTIAFTDNDDAHLITTSSIVGVTINGKGGNDDIRGGWYNDSLAGGVGTDSLTGGAGADQFLFNTALNGSTNVDVISDFSVADGDKIVLENAIFAAMPNVGTLSGNRFWSASGGQAHDLDDTIIYDPSTGALYYDADGTGSGAGVQFAQLAASLSLHASDFLVI